MTTARTSMVGQPRFVCEIASVVAMPIWFIGLIAVVNASKPIDNPAGIPIYGLMCLVLSVFVFPINATVIAPQLAKLAFRSLAAATIVHLMVGTIACGILWIWPSTLGTLPSLTWTIIPYYLSVFFFPPMLVGSYAYSLQYVRSNRLMGTSNSVVRSNGSTAS